jgi:hypothetical protein
MATLTQVRCAKSNRRLADYVNEVVAGQVILELKCSKCGQPHMEVIRHQSEMDPTGGSQGAVAGAAGGGAQAKSLPTSGSMEAARENGHRRHTHYLLSPP